MLERLTIKNFKSIVDVSVDLGRFNVFIGENGCGKTNILEALAMFAAAKSHTLDNESLYSRGIRIAKPSITFSSFVGREKKRTIAIECLFDPDTKVCAELRAQDPNDILSVWLDSVAFDNSKRLGLVKTILEMGVASDVSTIDQIKVNKGLFDSLLAYMQVSGKKLEEISDNEEIPVIPGAARTSFVGLNELIVPSILDSIGVANVADFLIYCLNTPALRGIQTQSRKSPLGIFGENLDILISQFTPDEIKELQAYAYLIPWLQDFRIDAEDRLKFEGHKLGRSTSTLYFKDRFMGRRNNVFSAENANEGVLHVLFYLTLFISGRTPKLFGIDNIETSLNPKVCRTLVKELAVLARKHEKQALITTHNPAVLDGLNLYDDEQRLFVVSRSDEGHTRVKRIQLKEKQEGESLKLSELWMRGVLGGLPVNF